MKWDHGLSGEEQRLADLLKRTVPEPPRQLTYEEITVQHAGRLRKSWLIPAMAAAAIMVIGGSIGAVAATRSGPSAPAAPPVSGQSSPAPVASPTGPTTPTCPPTPVPSISAIPVPPTATASAVPVPRTTAPRAVPATTAPRAVPATTAVAAAPTPTSAASVRVPSVVGLLLQQAERVLTQQGLVVRVVPDRRSIRAPGMVVQQAPAAGTTAASGTTVTVYVTGRAGSGVPSPVASPPATTCAYPEPSATPTASAYPVPSATASAPVAVPSATVPAEAMPNVIGETQAQAVRVLRRIGVSALLVGKVAGSGHVAAGTVWSQNPPAGSTVARGLTVTLYVQP